MEHPRSLQEKIVYGSLCDSYMDPCTKIVSCLCVPPAATLKWEEVSPCAHWFIVYCSIVILEHGGGDRSVNLQFPTRWWEPSPKQLSDWLGESFGTSCRVSRSAAFGSLTLTAKVPGNQPPDGEDKNYFFQKRVWITVRFVRKKTYVEPWQCWEHIADLGPQRAITRTSTCARKRFYPQPPRRQLPIFHFSRLRTLPHRQDSPLQKQLTTTTRARLDYKLSLMMR